MMRNVGAQLPDDPVSLVRLANRVDPSRSILERCAFPYIQCLVVAYLSGAFTAHSADRQTLPERDMPQLGEVPEPGVSEDMTHASRWRVHSVRRS
jgi:hypothetical protein